MTAANTNGHASAMPPDDGLDGWVPCDDDAPESVIVDAGSDRSKRAPLIELLDGPALAEPMPPLEYIVKEIGLVAGSGAPHLVAGYGFAGKTIAMQSLLLACAAGAAVWGAYTVESRRALRLLHVDMEQGRRLTARRYQRLAQPMCALQYPDGGIDVAEEGRMLPVNLSRLGDRLAVAIMPPISLSPEHAATWKELMTGRDVMLVDSLRAATGGEDENASGIRAGLDMLGVLSEQTGCRAIVIHHARKPGVDDPGGRYAIRGSSAIYDACDSVYVFSAAKGEPVLCEQVKARSHGEPTESVALVIGDVEGEVPDDEGIPRHDPRAGVRVAVHGAELVTKKREEREEAGRVERAKRDGERVRRVVGAQQGIGTVDLRAQSGLSGARLAAALSALGGDVEVRTETHGRTRRTAHYLKGAGT